MPDGPLITIAALGLVVLLVAGTEVVARLKLVQAEASRTFVHVTVGIAAALLPVWFSSPGPFYPVAAAAIIVTGMDGPRGWLQSIHGVERRTSGTAAFGAAFIIAAVLCWSITPDRSFVFSAAMLVLALADPLAAAVGTRIRGVAAGKTMRGSISFCVATLAIVAGVLAVTGVWNERGTVVTILAVLLCALVAAVAEHVVDRGYDNVAIVIAVCTTLHVSLLPSTPVPAVVAAVAVPPAFALLAVRARLLDGRGAAVAALLAATILLLWDWRWVVPGLLFFATASAMSRVGRSRKAQYAGRLRRGTVRDPVQVFANGGLPWLMLLGAAFVPADLWAWGYAGAFAAATADTWSTEAGMLSRSEPRDIRTGRRVPPGTSGAVSPIGTLAALAGAILIAGAALVSFGDGSVSVVAMITLTVAGFSGSLIDTLLGASVQALYVDIDGQYTEVEDGTRLVRGWRWLDNDGVNAMSGLTGAVIAIAGFLMFAA